MSFLPPTVDGISHSLSLRDNGSNIKANLIPLPLSKVGIAVLTECTSTNTLLMQDGAVLPPLLSLHGKPLSSSGLQILATHHQTAGRGQYGRAWVDEGGSNADTLQINSKPQALMFSVGWFLPALLADFPLLAHYPLPAYTTLLMGIAAIRALAECGFPAINIKWPNDLWWRGGKLSGLLTEQKKDKLVVGIGINVLPLSGSHSANPTYPTTSLSEIFIAQNTDGKTNDDTCTNTINGNTLIASLTHHFHHAFALIAQNPVADFSAYQHDFHMHDKAVGQMIRFTPSPAEASIKARYVGVDNKGAIVMIPEGRCESESHLSGRFVVMD